MNPSKNFELLNKKLIVFDFDETLAFTRKANFKAYEAACLAEGISIRFDEYLKTNGMDWRSSIRLFARTEDEKQIKRIHNRKNELFPEFISHIEPNEEIIRLVHQLHGTRNLCVATSGSRPTTLAALEHLGIKDKFDLILTSDEIDEGKPAPDIFLKAAEHFNCSPEDCVVFEDSERGFEACEAAGMDYFRV